MDTSKLSKINEHVLCGTIFLSNIYLTIFFLIEKSEPQMGLEPTTLRDLVGCSNHWATGDSMVSEGQFVGLEGY